MTKKILLFLFVLVLISGTIGFTVSGSNPSDDIKLLEKRIAQLEEENKILKNTIQVDSKELSEVSQKYRETISENVELKNSRVVLIDELRHLNEAYFELLKEYTVSMQKLEKLNIK